MSALFSTVAHCQSHDRLFGDRIAAQFALHPTLVHHDHAIGHSQDLLHIAGDKQDRDTLVGERFDDLVDFMFGTDVDAAVESDREGCYSSLTPPSGWPIDAESTVEQPAPRTTTSRLSSSTRAQSSLLPV